jgi:hypothetical protein
MSFLAGLATGYVLGARGGRERYEQITRLARKFADHPTVQQAAGTLQAQASRVAQTGAGEATSRLRASTAKLAGSLKPGWRHEDNATGTTTGHEPSEAVNGAYSSQDVP